MLLEVLLCRSFCADCHQDDDLGIATVTRDVYGSGDASANTEEDLRGGNVFPDSTMNTAGYECHFV